MIAIACDHAALDLKQRVIELLKQRGEEVRDFGTYTAESCHYPVFAAAAARAVASGECERGILICGTGIGMSLAANKVKGIRCALCNDVACAALSRQHNNANMLAFGARILDEATALKIVETWLDTAFEGGRHQIRIDMITALENGETL